tara:strand:+ start:1016 stop:2554 length:1539 start_codon:yes stop_codon:yes gene_type:complete
MSDKIKYHIIKPKVIDNGVNSCWINAPLFATSAHEIIILQHFILDNSRLVQGELDVISLFIQKFLNINRLDNLPWNNDTYLDIYNILSDIAYGDYFFNKKDPIPQYGYYGPGDIILQKFMGMITKNFDPRTSKLCYLKTETRVCRNKEEFNSFIENRDGNRKFELISFIASVCTDSINNLPQKPPTHMNTNFKKKLAKEVLKNRDMSHWNAYVLTNNGKWRYFDALKRMIKDINYDDIFNCSDDKGMHVCCIYIDGEKFNNIMNLIKTFNSFKIFIKYFNESKSKSNIDFMEFYRLSNDFILEYNSMQNIVFNPIGMLDPNAGQIQGPNPKSKSKSDKNIKLSDVDMLLDSQVLHDSFGSQKPQASKSSQQYVVSQVLPGSFGSQKSQASKSSQQYVVSQVIPGSFGSQILPDPSSKSSQQTVFNTVNSLFRSNANSITDKKSDSIGASSFDISHKITISMKKDIDILIKKNINLLKIEEIRKKLIKLKVKIPLGTIDIRGLLINTILKIKK